MFQLFIAFLLSLMNPGHSGTNGSNHHSNQVTTLDDSGGDTGHIPPTGPGGH